MNFSISVKLFTNFHGSLCFVNTNLGNLKPSTKILGSIQTIKMTMSYLEQFNQAQQGFSFKNWKVLEDEQQLEEILETSKEKPVVIFKHSTRCGISEGAKYTLMENWDFNNEELDFYYLDLLKYRPLSNRIAETFQVTHQSPQVLLVKDGEVAFHTSHHRISTDGLRKHL